MEQTSEWYANILQRLRDKTEALLTAYDAIEPPQTFIEAERAARALMAVAKLAAFAEKAAPPPVAEADLTPLFEKQLDAFVTRKWEEGMAKAATSPVIVYGDDLDDPP